MAKLDLAVSEGFRQGNIGVLLSARPNYLMLTYPVISMKNGITYPDTRQALLGVFPDEAVLKRYSTDTQVLGNALPTLMTLADDDKTLCRRTASASIAP